MLTSLLACFIISAVITRNIVGTLGLTTALYLAYTFGLFAAIFGG